MNKVLIVAAHPGDEVLGCGATIAKHTQRGDKVQVVFIPNYFVNIVDYFEIKIKALKFYDEEMRHYPHIRFYNSIENLSQFRGSLV